MPISVDYKSWFQESLANCKVINDDEKGALQNLVGSGAWDVNALKFAYGHFHDEPEAFEGRLLLFYQRYYNASKQKIACHDYSASLIGLVQEVSPRIAWFEKDLRTHCKYVLFIETNQYVSFVIQDLY